jgi:transposase
VDSSRIAVNRRQRRAKPDRLEVHQWRTRLRRYLAGEQRVWRVVRVPSVEEEDRRPLHRDLMTATRDRTRVTNRLRGLLASDGVHSNGVGDVAVPLEQSRPWDGSPLPPAWRARLARAGQKVGCRTQQIDALEAERREVRRTSQEPVMAKVRQRHTRRGIGTKSAWLSVMECFGGRELRHRQPGGA